VRLDPRLQIPMLLSQDLKAAYVSRIGFQQDRDREGRWQAP